MARSVCIVSPGDLTANPRIVKEAEALHEAGYAVTVLVSDHSTRLRGFDAEVASRAPWKVVNAPRSLAGRHVSAGSVRADLYIGHYVAGLHAAGGAAQQHGARLGFDAEDFHLGEERDDLRTEIVRTVEAAWLPRCRHLTAAAPLIGRAYAERYGSAVPATVLNVLPLAMAPPEEMVRLAAAYDVGLSLETDVSENRQFCLTNKIFTYLLAGVPAVMSDTPAQRQLARDLGEAAVLVSLSDPQAVAAAIDRLASGVDAAKAHAVRLGRERYNWDVEKKTLLASVEAAFAEAPCRR